jgi:ubiquinone/menaquinone biosynthesis C-methylase UbiE
MTYAKRGAGCCGARATALDAGTAFASSSDVRSRDLIVGAPNESVGSQRFLDLRVLDHVRIKAWDRLLFVECGDGWLVEEAWRRLGKGCVCGLSRSEQLVDLAVRLRGVPGRVEFKRWDGERFPFTNRSFDHAISCVPCSRYREPGAVLREMARVLRPDGDAYLFESDGSTPELPPARSTADLERLLVAAGFGDVRRSRCDTARSGQQDDGTAVVIHARQCSPGT